MKFSALVISLLPTLALGQAFGRFGYSSSLLVPGLSVDKGGFRAKLPGATAFRFEQPSTYWKVVETTPNRQGVSLSGKPWCPAKVRQDLTAVGFSLYVERGLGLKLSSAQAPYISWAEGSVGTDVASAPARWAMISFRDAQPPVVLGFLDGSQGLKLTGRPGDWTIRTGNDYRGWIRVALPFGLAGRATSTAATLGAASRAVSAAGDVWYAPPAQLKETRLVSDDQAVTVTWEYDRPGAVVPTPLALAPITWYRLSTASKINSLDGYTEEGPQAVLGGRSLSVRLPVRRLYPGRAITEGRLEGSPIATVSALDPAGIAELSLATLCAQADEGVREAGRMAAADYFENLLAVREPNTTQNLPYAVDGEGLDILAAHALLKSARITAGFELEPGNALLTSLSWRRDALTWQLARTETRGEMTRRAAALAALAGWLLGTDEGRLEAALFEAGLAAQEALPIWLKRRGVTQTVPRRETLAGLRKLVFNRTTLVGDDTSYKPLLSPLRVLGQFALEYEKGALSWSAPREGTAGFTLIGPVGDILPSVNLSAIRLTPLGGLLVDCDVKSKGRCEASVTLTQGAIIPRMHAWPAFTER